MRWTHLIWDWNGTLFDDAWLGIDVMNRMLARRGMETMTAERYMEIFDFPVRDYYLRIGFDFHKESFEKLGTEFIDNYELRRHEAGLHADARPTLQSFRDAGIRQSVLSAYKHATLEELLADCGVREFFDHVVGSDDHYASGKVEQGKRFLERLGVPASQLVLVGDTVHDFEVARAMGIDCILVTRGYHSHAKLMTCGVPVVSSLTEVRQRVIG